MASNALVSWNSLEICATDKQKLVDSKVPFEVAQTIDEKREWLNTFSFERRETIEVVLKELDDKHGDFYFVQLSHPRHFRSEFQAVKALGKMKVEEDFDGKFDYYSNVECHVFTFTATSRASDANYGKFKMTTKKINTELILPKQAEVMVTIELDMHIATRGEIEKAIVTREFNLFSEICGALYNLPSGDLPPGAKKIKEDIESKMSKVQSVLPITLRPNEDDRTKHIVQQIATYAKQKKLKLFNHTTILSDYGAHKFSKYSTSKPDIVVIGHNNTIAIATVYDTEGEEEGDEHIEEDEREEEGDEHDVTKKFDRSTLVAEAKIKGNNDKVVGQMLAGMDKTLGDVFHQSIVEGSVLTKLTMYGLILQHEVNCCHVFKANVVIDKKTTLYQGVETLTVSDAVNRVFFQLVH